MTTIAMPLPQMITRDTEGNTGFREISAKLGDGNMQSAPDGLNAVIDGWTIKWAPLTQVQYNTVKSALKSIGTWGTITWTPCDETVQKNVKLASTKFTWGRVNRSLYWIQADIEEDFRV